MRKFVLTAAMGLLLAAAVAIAGIGGTPAEANGDTAAVQAPNQLMAHYTGPLGVLVAWQSLVVPSGHKLVVYRNYVSGPGPTGQTVIASLPGGDRDWGAVLDRSTTAGATYQYHASIYAEGSDSAVAKSQEFIYHVSVKPHTLSAYRGRDGGVDLRWTPGAHPKFVKQLVLRRPAGASSWTTIAEIGPRNWKYLDTTAESGTKYSYRVKAEKATGKGGQTNRVKFTAP